MAGITGWQYFYLRLCFIGATVRASRADEMSQFSDDVLRCVGAWTEKILLELPVCGTLGHKHGYAEY